MIHNRKDQLHEAHMHVLVNMMQREIVTMHAQHDRIACLHYACGYKPQREIWKHEVRERLSHAAPPLLIYLSYNHYEALRPNVLPQNVYELDEEDA